VSTANYQLFSRAGSVLVLFAVVVEYRRLPLHQERLEKGEILASGYVRYKKWSGTFQIIGVIAHISIILGTLIAGYGDIFIDFIKQLM
jgi:hypothetical protein